MKYPNGYIGSLRDYEFVRVLYEAMHPRTLVQASLRLSRVLPPAGQRVHMTFGLRDEISVWA